MVKQFENFLDVRYKLNYAYTFILTVTGFTRQGIYLTQQVIRCYSIMLVHVVKQNNEKCSVIRFMFILAFKSEVRFLRVGDS